jgi:hypothetical protein
MTSFGADVHGCGDAWVRVAGGGHSQAKMMFRTATARSVYELLTDTQQVKQALPVNEKFLTGRMTFECVSRYPAPSLLPFVLRGLVGPRGSVALIGSAARHPYVGWQAQGCVKPVL